MRELETLSRWTTVRRNKHWQLGVRHTQSAKNDDDGELDEARGGPEAVAVRARLERCDEAHELREQLEQRTRRVPPLRRHRDALRARAQLLEQQQRLGQQPPPGRWRARR